MYNKTPFGVRRAHSFDSYDNLDKWQAIREHRLQFLSTRAKFDKLPPSEPPPPPPRHASKFKIHPPSSSISPVSQLIQNFTEEMKGMSTPDKKTSTSENKDNIGVQSLNVSKNVPHHTNFNDEKFTQDPAMTDKSIFEHTKFKSLDSPGSVLQVTQSWQKYRLGETLEKENEISNHQSLPISTVEHKTKYTEVANEPHCLRKRVNSVGYEEPTFYQDVYVNRITENLTNSASLSDGSKGTKVLHSHSSNTGKECLSLSPVPPLLKRPSEFIHTAGSRSTSQNAVYPYDSNDNSFSKDINYKRLPFQKAVEKPKFNTQENRRIYLESTLFTNNQLDNNDFVLTPTYNHASSSTKPRRISTGSMHEPTNWRSQTSAPVKVLVKKFSQVDTKSIQKL